VITVAITTFNRADVVGTAIRSALLFAAKTASRVVLLDDASTDRTDSAIGRQFAPELASGTLTYAKLDKNCGTSAAKNAAFDLADPGWVIFLDSDDELLPSASEAVALYLRSHEDVAVIFFRCIDETNEFVGRQFPESQILDFPRYIAHTSYGEALVAINKRLENKAPFDADLRGYEGLGCAQLIKKFKPALQPLPLRPSLATRRNLTESSINSYRTYPLSARRRKAHEYISAIRVADESISILDYGRNLHDVLQKI
jgi:glycosyltransferase involved in cell wall biosynthesis